MFLISFLMVFISSYFCSSVFCAPLEGKVRKFNPAFLILLVSFFAQIVLTFEALSLFKAINQTGVLVLQTMFLTLSIVLWLKKGRPLWKPQIKKTLARMFGALKKDKILMIMAFGFLFFITVTVLLNLFLPVSSYDALTYHLNRAAFWLSQGSLNHFEITDERNLVMPINSEILYLWILLFFKNDIGLNFFTFFGYIASIFSVYNLLALFGYSERKKLWSVFILSSFASVMAQASSVETDVLIAGLVLSSITLFVLYLQEKKISLIFFSALAYALAMGTKSPAVIAFPGVFLLLTFLSYKQLKKDSIKPLGIFLGLLFVNFVVFSSYNYILNFVAYGNFFGSESARALHGFRGGVKAFVANYIRYIFMMFDFSGFRYSDYVGEHITNAKLAILTFLHIPHELGVEMTDNNVINNRLMDVKMGTGLLGFLLFLPSAITAVILGLIDNTKKKVCSLFAFGSMFFINLCALSFSIAFMVFSVRFVTFLIVISAPVLALSYIKKTNILKLLILFFVMSYFLVISVNLASRPCADVLTVILQEKTLNDAREKIRCSLLNGYEGRMPFCYLRDIARSTPKGSSFGLIPGFNSRLYVIKMLETEGYKVDVLIPEKISSYDLSKYDYLVTTDTILTSTVLLRDTKHAKIDYKLDKDGNAYFDSKNPANCVYIDHNSEEPYTKGMKNGVIMNSMCFVSKNFLNAKGFDFVQSYDFQSIIPENANFMTIYKKRNP